MRRGVWQYALIRNATKCVLPYAPANYLVYTKHDSN